ncbi:maintenance of ploidy protein mob1, partial [Aureobasidium melanogenum]
MATFMQTMLVQSSPPRPHFPIQARPLPALHSHVLAASESWSQLSLCFPDSPRSTHTNTTSSSSPAQNRFRDVLGKGSNSDANMFATCSNASRGTRSSFRPARTAKGTNSWQLKQFAEATLGSGSLRKVVRLPEGEDKDEWLAVNVVDFYNQINLLYGAITEFCSPHSCPEMKATDEFEYLWHHPPEFPRPVRLPAPSYISNLLSWTSNLLSDANVFPTHPGVPFPPTFQSTIKQIFKRLYRIYAHIYCHHYGVIRGLGLEAHLNTGFKHYVLFVEEFGLADEGGRRDAKAEWYGPLGELVESMLRSD